MSLSGYHHLQAELGVGWDSCCFDVCLAPAGLVLGWLVGLPLPCPTLAG